MNETIFQQELGARGFSIAEAARRTGLAYVSVQRHARGERVISGESAKVYEERLGIPREKLRPDLFVWTPSPRNTPCAQAAPAFSRTGANRPA